MSGFVLRLVFLCIILIIIYRLVQRAIHNSTAQSDAHNPSAAHTASHANNPPRPQIMRPCAQCQVHIPEGESTQSRGYFFCCETHRDEFFMSTKNNG